MFDQTFVNTQTQTRKPWTVAMSAALQVLLVAALLIAPLLHVASLGPIPKIPIWAPVEKLDLKVRPEPRPKSVPLTKTPRVIFRVPTLQPPTSVPRHIDMTPDAPSVAIDGGFTNAAAGPSLTSLLAAGPEPQPAKPEPKPQPNSATPTTPLHIGGDVQAAKLVFGPRPAYPPLARAARVQGTVRIQATIGRDGSIRNLQVLSGPPLLVEVALEAVRQWRYQPTLLNSQPVEVITEIAVNFTLAN